MARGVKELDIMNMVAHDYYNVGIYSVFRLALLFKIFNKVLDWSTWMHKIMIDI